MKRSGQLFQEYYRRAHPPYESGVQVGTLEQRAETMRWARMWILHRDLTNLVVIKP